MDKLHPLFAHPTQKLWNSCLPRKSQLVYPIFVVDGENQKQPINSMPNVYRYSVDLLKEFLEPLVVKGLKAVLIFGVIGNEGKDELGSLAGGLGKESCVHKALRLLKQAFPQLLLITDVCLCAYTSHGHCGILTKDGYLDNQASIKRLSECALSYAQAGADIVAPSDMMDNRVGAIKELLDQHPNLRVPIMSYSSKFCSALYGPFRDVCCSAPQKFDRSSYQLPPGGRQLALQAAERDLKEGAGYVMVKPITAYLDIAAEIKRRHPDTLLACYHVSGEYSMIHAGAEKKLFDLKRVVLEYMEGFVRTGIDIIITYFTPELLDWLE
ncbi:unnamed protein product [Paramecium octaurelia]|uniref:Delta-aminolevulinic acid dehydratase n=1 Tax=Paramecium octaurelia TaxID=43137 RepID=A0A8S1UMS6_PAROT|nr:unnamed protein product [Paramecium octaurelia]